MEDGGGSMRPLMTYVGVMSIHMKKILAKSVRWLGLVDSFFGFAYYFKYIDFLVLLLFTLSCDGVSWGHERPNDDASRDNGDVYDEIDSSKKFDSRL
ncbi:hypothetical protein AVEN_82719-1 [Araneus ventricosus]|uniref:Transmembrane protein n=1 Tax=Araneus ventricosus TaxID=182803 RepID=A0A4Y2PFC5_ARAVE|nr:hypothetical protein AVEN_82719-1 [Araneus ventricosus]